MWTVEVVAIVCATFLFAGWVKGVVGLGLPVGRLGRDGVPSLSEEKSDPPGTGA